jgi:single-stranded-DNA-specific exonuclease
LDSYARARLTPADFEPAIEVDGELPLHEVTPELFQSLRYLEPFGQGNPEPVFAAARVRLMQPPRTLKDKHVKLKLAPAVERVSGDDSSDSATRAAVLTTPRCHPDAAAFRRDEVRAASEHRPSGTENWRRAITFDALAWRMAERMEAEKLLAGDTLDIAFTIGNNDHPEFGGLELTVCDFKAQRAAETPGPASPEKSAAAKVSSPA